jgi:hypothetical protein
MIAQSDHAGQDALRRRNMDNSGGKLFGEYLEADYWLLITDY